MAGLNNTTTADVVVPGEQVAIADLITLVVLASLGLIVNVSNVVVAASIPGVLSCHLRLVVNLAVADLFVDIVALFAVVSFFFDFFSIHPSVYVSMLAFSYLATLCSMVGLSVNMCIAVWNPLRYRQLVTKGRISVWIAITWISSALMAIATGTGHYFDISSKMYLVSLLSGIGMCFVVLVCSYTIICTQMVKLRRRADRMTGQRPSNRKIILTSSLVIGSYILCWSIWPALVVVGYFGIDPGVFCVMNSLIDACVYALRLPEFNSRYGNASKRLTRCCRR